MPTTPARSNIVKIVSRNPHKPTPETTAQVEALSGYGIRHDEIAIYLGIDAKTLRKHYREQLDKGVVKANVGVARALHKNATEGNVTAQIFWLKARAGWRDKPEDETRESDLSEKLSELINRLPN